MPWSPTDEMPHDGVAADEWVFAVWSPDGAAGFVSGHRLLGATAWYWSGVVELGRPLLHLTEWEVRVRADPFVVKAPEMWAEHHCVAPMEQWSVGNEAHAAALERPDDALGRAYGTPTPMACDVEWYAIGGATAIDHGYEQVGVAHGDVELLGRPDLRFEEAPAHRWRRWLTSGSLDPLALAPAVAHVGLRVPFAFPDGSVGDWVLTVDGFRSRRSPGSVIGRRPPISR